MSISVGALFLKLGPCIHNGRAILNACDSLQTTAFRKGPWPFREFHPERAPFPNGTVTSRNLANLSWDFMTRPRSYVANPRASEGGTDIQDLHSQL